MSGSQGDFLFVGKQQLVQLGYPLLLPRAARGQIRKHAPRGSVGILCTTNGGPLGRAPAVMDGVCGFASCRGRWGGAPHKGIPAASAGFAKT
jgi:hypothetical protein